MPVMSVNYWKHFSTRLESNENLDKFYEKLNVFQRNLNEFHPNLKFTYENVKEKVHMVINIKEGRRIICWYLLWTYGWSTCRADHIRITFIFNQTFWLKIISSGKNDLNAHVRDLKRALSRCQCFLRRSISWK